MVNKQTTAFLLGLFLISFVSASVTFEYLNNVYIINKYRTINLDNQNIYLINFILK